MSDALRNEATERLHIDYEKLVKDVDGLLKEVKALQHENNPEYVETLRYKRDHC